MRLSLIYSLQRAQAACAEAITFSSPKVALITVEEASAAHLANSIVAKSQLLHAVPGIAQLTVRLLLWQRHHRLTLVSTPVKVSHPISCHTLHCRPGGMHFCAELALMDADSC